MTETVPAPKRRGRRFALWGGGFGYGMAVVLLLFGAPDLSGGYHAVGSLLAVSLLAGPLRTRPTPVLVLTLLGSLAVVMFTRDDGLGRFLAYLGPDVALAFVVATRTRRTWVTSVAVVLTVQVVSVAGLSHGPNNLVGTTMFVLLAVVTCCAVGLLNRERREHAEALRAQEVAEAVTAERLRIARELHDMVAHSIGIVAIQAGVGSRVIETRPDQAREALRAVESTSRETLAGLRRTLVALRQADPTPVTPVTPVTEAASLAPTPGLDDVDRLVERTADAGVRVEVRWNGARRPLPADVDLAAYRVVQEAVTNVVRHADVPRCRVAIDYREGELSLEIVDEGRGVTDGQVGAGFGITGMRERVSLLNGHFSAGPAADGGFRVAVGLPLPGDASAGAEAR